MNRRLLSLGVIAAFLAVLLCFPAFSRAGLLGLGGDDDDFPNPFKLPGPPPVRSWIHPDTKEIGGPFNLIDQNGKHVTEKDYDKFHKLILFGYTNSRVQSQVALRLLTKTLENMGDQADNIRILFITVDPKRDTPEAMKKYMEKFWSNRIVGLTGTVEEIAQVENKFRIFSEKVTDPRYKSYIVNHSTVIYFTAPDGGFLASFNSADSPPIIAGRIRQKMAKAD